MRPSSDLPTTTISRPAADRKVRAIERLVAGRAPRAGNDANEGGSGGLPPLDQLESPLPLKCQGQGGRGGYGVWLIGGAAIALWLAAAATGLFWLMAYDNTPGAAADAPHAWPADTALTRDPVAPTLVMLAHPRCDCTRASLGELAELLARVKFKPRTFVVFIKPGGTDSGWEQSGTWEQAREIPGVTVVRDDDGAEARRFGVHTSGQTLLYDARGALLYSGGTTGSRGKAGENAGRADLIALVDGARRLRATQPVFGCPLFSHEAPAPAQAQRQVRGRRG